MGRTGIFIFLAALLLSGPPALRGEMTGPDHEEKGESGVGISSGISPGISIVLRETSDITGERVRLGDVADIRVTDDAGVFVKQALDAVDLGLSPRPDRIKSIRKRKIASVIRGRPHLPKDIRVKGPDRIYVKRMGREITVEEVRAFVETRLSEMYGDQTYELRGFTVRGLEPYPPGEIKWVCDDRDLAGRNGKLSASLDLVIDGRRQGRVSVSGIISSDPLIREGDFVSLSASGDGLLIVTTGVAREDGFRNDVIRIENLSSGKVVRGKVKEKSLVEVMY